MTEVASLLKSAKQHERLAGKYRRDEEGYERNMDRASDFRRQAQDLLDSGAGKPDADDQYFWVYI